jgi:uncharacterized protein (DUF4415 family)
MRKTYDFSHAKPNPYARLLKRQVTLRLDEPTLNYFKALSQDMAIPYQTLINLYLRECAATHKQLRLAWEAPRPPKSA